jgi:peptidoglycan/LPS O-acetylase OafA/YrhL
MPRGGLGYYKYIYYASWCRFDELVAGVALALLKNYHPVAWVRLTSHGNRTLLAGIVATALMMYIFLTDHVGEWVTVVGYPALAASFSLLLIAALSPASALYRLRVPGAASLALWSYAIYLLHKQLCILLRPTLQDLGYGADSVPAILASIAVSIATGWLLYVVVETPFMRLRARYVPANHA